MTEPGRMRRWPTPSLVLTTDRRRLRRDRLEVLVSQAVTGGVNVVQLREKDLPTQELYDLAITVHAVVRGRALFLVNDRVDVALAAGADGVHLPERSLPVHAVRDIAGEACIVGRSVHGVEAAVEAAEQGADFLVVGNVFPTQSKPGAAGTGVDLVSEVADAVRIPVIAIGGITADNAASVVAAGAAGVAVISAIADADDPKTAAEALHTSISEAYGAPAHQ